MTKKEREADRKDRVEFGRGVKAARALFRYTLTGLARAVGCSHQLISNIEQGNNWPSIPVYRRLCKALHLRNPPLL